MEVCKKLIEQHSLTKEEALTLLSLKEDPSVREVLRKEAVKVRNEIFGTEVYVRGLIEFTNYCRNNCYYCGIRAGNPNVERYRLAKEEILECCREGYALSYRTFVLQGGEDMHYSTEDMADIISSIKKEFPDCAVTLSIGEHSYDTYKKFRKAGADRYLLRHETADETHYGKLHPENLKLSNRKECLYNLKKLGFQVGAGFMVGSPYQTPDCLAEDLVFLQDLKPEMIGIGPFIPHHDTPFKFEPTGSISDTLFLLSILRLLFPKVLLPATTALGTLTEDGREQGIFHGANVVMPNLSPVSKRGQYELYDNKRYSGAESAQGYQELQERMERIGYHLVSSRGDYPLDRAK